MWLSKQCAAAAPGEPAPLLGSVTLSDTVTAARTDAEWRDVTVCGPGGYCWRPPTGASVLVLKDPDGKKPYAVAEVPRQRMALEPGEIWIQTGGAAIRLSPGGRIDLTGDVWVNGSPL